MPEPFAPLQDDGRLYGVVAGIQRDDGRWLLIRRSAAVVRAPLKVCFPGGSVEIGETLEQAVAREMLEELGVIIRPVRLCWRWDSPAVALTVFGWHAELVSGEPTPNLAEVAEVLWLDAEEASSHPDGLATNRDFLECLARETREMTNDETRMGAE